MQTIEIKINYKNNYSYYNTVRVILHAGVQRPQANSFCVFNISDTFF